MYYEDCRYEKMKEFQNSLKTNCHRCKFNPSTIAYSFEQSVVLFKKIIYGYLHLCGYFLCLNANHLIQESHMVVEMEITEVLKTVRLLIVIDAILVLCVV